MPKNFTYLAFTQHRHWSVFKRLLGLASLNVKGCVVEMRVSTLHLDSLEAAAAVYDRCMKGAD